VKGFRPSPILSVAALSFKGRRLRLRHERRPLFDRGAWRGGIRIAAGGWIAHCHIAEHDESGMMVDFDGAPADGDRAAVTDR
jgi:Multicopper oxidase